MERILFSKIPVWVVGILGVLSVIATIGFANISVFVATHANRGGVLREPILTITNIRQFLRKTDQNEYVMVDESKHPGKSGFDFSYEPGTKADAGYLLLSRYDGDDRRSYVDLVDLNTQKSLHRWAPDTDAVFAKSKLKSIWVDLARDRPEDRMVYFHPYPTDDGGLLVQSLTPLVKFDVCSQFVWMNEDSTFHHSINTDAEGNFWIPADVEPTEVAKVDPLTYRDNSLMAVTSDGETISNTSVSAILINNELAHLAHNAGLDPTHVNDIQPVLEDGPYWKKGDLFVSLRTPSMVMLYRPSTGKIIWRHMGLWYAQHDVDILDDHRISVFNNNAVLDHKTRSSWRSLGTNDIVIYDFAKGEFSSPYKDALAKHGVATVSEGLDRILPNGELFVEEQNYGRIMQLTKEGDVVWEYVNRAEMGRIFRVSWSRFLTNEEAAPIVASIEKANCSP